MQNLFWIKKKNNYQNSIIEIEQAEVEFDNNIKDMVESYNYNINLWFVATKSYQLSQEQFILLSHKFNSGKVSAYELASAQQEQYKNIIILYRMYGIPFVFYERLLYMILLNR